MIGGDIMIGGTRDNEGRRTAEMLEGINNTQGLYFVVAMLADSQCDNAMLRIIMKELEKNPRNMWPKGHPNNP